MENLLIEYLKQADNISLRCCRQAQSILLSVRMLKGMCYNRY